MAQDKTEWVMSWGKYKGKKVKEMLKDKNYCQWLKHQEWLFDRAGWLDLLLNPIIYCKTCGDCQMGLRLLGKKQFYSVRCPACGYGQPEAEPVSEDECDRL